MWSALSNVHKAYGARTIHADLDFQIRRKERWCIMGVNGAGKIDAAQIDCPHHRA